MNDAEFVRNLREPYASKEERELIARQIEEVVRDRDENDIWSYLLHGRERDEYIHAIRLIRAGIDMNSVDITPIRVEVYEIRSRKQTVA